MQLSGNGTQIQHNSFVGNAIGVSVSSGGSFNTIGYPIGFPTSILQTPADSSNSFLLNSVAGVWIQYDAGVGNAVLGNLFESPGSITSSVAQTATDPVLPIDLGFIGATSNGTTSLSDTNHLQHYPTLSHAFHTARTNWIEFALTGGAVTGNVQVDIYSSSTCAAAATGTRAIDAVRIASIAVAPTGGNTYVGNVDQWVKVPLSELGGGKYLSGTATSSDGGTSELGDYLPVDDGTKPTGDAVFLDNFGDPEPLDWFY